MSEDNPFEIKPTAPVRSPFLDRIAAISMFIAGVSMVVLIVIFGWLVFGRYVLNDTPTWVEQVALLLVVYITFIGAAVGVHRNTHLSIEFIRDMLPEKPRLFLIEVSDVAMIVFAGFMTWQGFGLVISNLSREIPMLGIPESWRAAPLVICGVLILIFSSARIVARMRLRKLKRG